MLPGDLAVDLHGKFAAAITTCDRGPFPMDLLSARHRMLVLAVLAAGTAVGFAVDAVGGAPFVLWAATAFIVLLVVGQRVAWLPATALTVVGLLAAYAVAVRVLQPIPVDLGTKNRVVVLVVALVGLALCWSRRDRLRLPSLRRTRPLLVALSAIAVTVVAALVAVAASDGTRVAWAMQNDAIWNTVMARFLYADLGAGPAHPNVSPLIPALLAGAFAPGRGAVPASELLQHDVSRQAELWLLLLLLSSILAGLVAWRALARCSRVGRGIGTLLVALIPLSWYCAGYAFQFGFYNATVSLIALLGAWIGWSTAREGRLASVAILSASTIVMLATWAPLGIVTIGLGIGVLAGGRRDWWRSIRGTRLAVFVLSLAGLPLYLVAITLPDVLRESKALAADGGIIAIQPHHVALVGVVGVAVTALLALGRGAQRDWAPLMGVLIVGAASALALGYLVLQRSGQGSWWGYYPQKLSWLVASLLIIVIAVSLAGLAPRRRALRAVAVAAAVLVVGALMSSPLPTRTSLYALASVFLPAPQLASDETTERLFASSDVSQFTVFARFGSPGEDSFVNNWLIQQRADSGDDPVRSFAYILDGTDLDRLCSLAATADADLVVRTRDDALAAELDAVCPAAEITVHVG